MLKLKNYTKEQLETWRTSRIGGLYINAFLQAGSDSNAKSLLEITTEILSSRPLKERTDLCLAISSLLETKFDLSYSVRSESNMRDLEKVKDMLAHYTVRVLIK